MSQSAANNLPPTHAEAPALRGLLAEFASPGALITAAEKVRDAGYTRWDTHSPFPVHGIDAAMGIRRTRLPLLVFGLGVIGCLTGLILQWWTNATGPGEIPGVPNFLQGYDYLISGKPKFSLPANIPVIFETTVLLAALAAVFGMLAMNNLPRFHNALFRSERFRRVTTDRFFVAIDARDAKFDAAATTGFLESLGGTAVEPIEQPPSPRKFPQPLVIGALVMTCLALFPPLIVAKARVSKSSKPRIHPIQDMDNQPRFKAQQAAPLLFQDGRAARAASTGTVARGDWPRDEHFDDGKVNGRDATAYPPQVTVNEPFIRRGQQQFIVFCAPCHGLGGAGDGMVNQRALELDTANWVQPTSLHDPLIRERSLGHLYNTIAHGIRSMPPYADQIPPVDCSAIVAYVRALQFSQHAPKDAVPPNLWPRKR